MSLAGLSLQAFPSLLPIDPTLNVSLRALASAHIRAPPAAVDVSDPKSVSSAQPSPGTARTARPALTASVRPGVSLLQPAVALKVSVLWQPHRNFKFGG